MAKNAGFASGVITIGELQVVRVQDLELIWEAPDGKALFYKPSVIPPGFRLLGHRAEIRDAVLDNLDGVLVVCEHQQRDGKTRALSPPVDFKQVWSSSTEKPVTFWLPVAPTGYKPVGFLVSKSKPSTEDIVCVREDLTTDSSISKLAWKLQPPQNSSNMLSCWIQSIFFNWRRDKQPVSEDTSDLFVYQTRPRNISESSRGISTGTFYCSASSVSSNELVISTLQNLQPEAGMPDKQQVENLVKRYGPLLYLHPDEAYFPSSVTWFFKNGALLYSKSDVSNPVHVEPDGSNLPQGGSNDGSYWLDLPSDSSQAELVRQGDLTTAVGYLHVKPMLGGTYTDLQFFTFYPFNGPATLKVGPLNIKLDKIGRHVSDWEHLTLRIDNFSGTLSRVYLSEHSKGTWFQPSDLEYDKDTTQMRVYASKHGHATYAHPGANLQGDEGRGIGIQNETKKSKFAWNLSSNYEIISADYLGIQEPAWLQFMREWGPKIEYNSRSELEKIIGRLPKKIRRSVEEIFDKFPNELSGEEGPTGPKVKNFWSGDER